MARTTTKTPDTATKSEAPKPSPALNLSVRRSEGVKRAPRTQQDNPTEEAVKASLTEGALAYDVANAEAAKQVKSLLRRAALKLKVGLSLSETVHPNGSVTVDFQAKQEKRTRKYTGKDIRAYFKATRNEEFTGGIPAQHREAFKDALAKHDNNVAKLLASVGAKKS